MKQTVITITAEESGERIDALLARSIPDMTRSRAQKLLEDGCVRLGGAPVTPLRVPDAPSRAPA